MVYPQWNVPMTRTNRFFLNFILGQVKTLSVFKYIFFFCDLKIEISPSWTLPYADLWQHLSSSLLILSSHQPTPHTWMVLHPCTPSGIRKHLSWTSVELSVPSEWTLDPTLDNHLICLIWRLGCELLESTAGVLCFSKYFCSPLNIIIGKMLSFLDQSVVDRIVGFLLLFTSLLPSSWPISAANQP